MLPESFHFSRFLAVLFVLSAVVAAAIEGLAPHRRFGRPAIAADVEVRVVPRMMPTAETARRRVLSTENLTTVYHRAVDSPEPDTDSADLIDKKMREWRRLLAVEVRPSADRERCRIRIVADGAERPVEGARLVEAIAAQYAGDIAAERWYEAVDRLRAAESAVDTAVRQLIRLVDGRDLPPSPNVSFSHPRLMAPDDGPTAELEHEIVRLMQIRASLLDTLQPAHPQVAALDARLATLKTAQVNGSPIRRMSAEEDLNLNPPQTAAEAAARVERARTALQIAMEAMLDPAAAEFPVVSTAVTGLNVWSTKPFWYAVGSLPCFGLAVLVCGSRRKATIGRYREVVAQAAGASPTYQPSAEPPTSDMVETAADVEAASGLPVLAVISRRKTTAQRRAAPPQSI